MIPIDVVIAAPVTVFFHAIPRPIRLRTALSMPRNFAIDSRPVMLQTSMAFIISACNPSRRNGERDRQRRSHKNLPHVLSHCSGSF
jgi:hypothetical protein